MVDTAALAGVPAYERDPYATQLETRVLEVGTDERGAWVSLGDTILYPEGGGQPADRGFLDGVPVLDVQRAAGSLRHYLGAEAPAAGAQVVVGLDWSRRFDHMQQHTAQHLLSALAEDRHGWRTTSFHLGEAVSDVELDVAALGAGQLSALEEEIAAEVRAARPVTARRLAPEAVPWATVRTRGLPEGHQGPVRLVTIADLDTAACGGTHVGSTAELEAVKLLHTEPMRGGTRLAFVAGRRARLRLGAREALAAALRGVVGTPDEELVTAVDALREKSRASGRAAEDLRELLAASVAAELATRGRVACAHFPSLDAAFPVLVAQAFSRLDAGGVALVTAGVDGGAFALATGAASTADAQALGRIVAEALAGRGGGSARVFQGRAPSFDGRADAEAALRAAVSGAVGQ